MAPTSCAASATRSSTLTSPGCWKRSTKLENAGEIASSSRPPAVAQLEARAVILATGADAVRLTVPGADRYFLHGVAYSTVSYAPLYIDKAVALVGAGRWPCAARPSWRRSLEAALPDRADPRRAGHLPGPQAAAAAEHVTLLENWEPVGCRRRHLRSAARRQGAGRASSARWMWTSIFVELGLKPHTELVQGWVRAGRRGPGRGQLRRARPACPACSPPAT